MYETGKTEESPNAKGLALRINKNFTDYVENFEKHRQNAKLNYTEKHASLCPNMRPRQ